MRWVAILVVVAVGCAGRARPQPKYTAAERRLVAERARNGHDAFRRDKLVKAAEHFDWLIESYPDLVDSQLLAERAAVFLLAGDYEAGLAFVDQVALPLAKKPAFVLEQRALLLVRLGRRDAAVADAERAVEEVPQLVEAQQIVGRHYYGRNPARCATAYEAYLRFRDPRDKDDDRVPRLRLAISYIALGKHDEAIAQLKQTREQFPHVRSVSVNVANGLCAAYVGKEEFERAISICEDIVRNERYMDRRHSAELNLARAYLEVGRTEDALAMARRYIEPNPLSPKGWRTIAAANIRLHRCDDADYALDRAERHGVEAEFIEAGRQKVATCRAGSAAAEP